MAKKKKAKKAKKQQKTKLKLHGRNKHRDRYNFYELVASYPELEPFVLENEYGDQSIDFFNPAAVKALNTALLYHFYDIKYWSIPNGYLVPPIPGRADYIHHIAASLRDFNKGIIPTGETVMVLDIGVGANCAYPIVGNKEYGWSFIGSDIDPIAVKSASNIVAKNKSLKDKVSIRLQNNSKAYFKGIIKKDELVDVVICNPPFHGSAEEALASTQRKLKNLTGKKVEETVLNFGGKSNELWYVGGERKFVLNLIHKSKQFEKSCFWFSTLVSKQSNLKGMYEALEKLEAAEVKTIAMGQGNKISRIVAWTFLKPEQQRQWRNKRWKNIVVNEPVEKAVDATGEKSTDV